MRIRLLDAAKLLSRSTGTAPGKLDYLERIIKSFSGNTKLKAASIFDLAFSSMRQPNNVGFAFLRLAYYLDLVDRRGDFFFLTPLGIDLLELYNSGDKYKQKLFLLERILSWPPMDFFVRYVIENPRCSLEDVNSDLGSQMKIHSKTLFKYEIVSMPRQSDGVEKPFNKAIIRGLLYRLAWELGLLEKTSPEGPYVPSSLAYRMYGLMHKEEDVVWTRAPDERYILAALIQILKYDRDVIIISPWVSPRVVESILLGFASNIRRIYIRAGEAYNRRGAKLLEDEGVDVVEVPRRRFAALHSKVIVGRESFMISSANLTWRSLYTNIEVGVYVESRSKAYKIGSLAEKILDM